MEEEYDIASKFLKSKKPLVPDGFFANFYNSIKDEIDAEDAFLNLNIVKRKKPSIPENFSVNFSSEIDKKITPKFKNHGRVIRLSFISAVASVAAVLTILFYLNQNNEPIQISNAVPTFQQDDEAFEAYVAYLDEDEMIDYIVENDISVGESDDDIYDYVESEIEDTYLDL